MPAIVAGRLVKVSLEMDGSLTMFSKDNQCLSTGEVVSIEVLIIVISHECPSFHNSCHMLNVLYISRVIITIAYQLSDLSRH